MIDARAVSRNYGSRAALTDVTFSVERGAIVGFLGPNGAGKTTTMRILTGFLPATSGDVRVAGFDVFQDPYEVKRRVGYLAETPPLYPELTVGAYLRFIAELRGYAGRERLARAGRAMDRVGLLGWEGRVLGTLSKGYKQRVGLAQAILHDPDVLILDEPTSGLDPGQVAGIRDLVRSLAGTHTVLLSTHVLSEVEAMCPRAIVISGGKIRADGLLAELRAGCGAGAWIRAEVRGVAPRALGEVAGVTQVEPIGAPVDGWQDLRVRAPEAARPAIAAAVVRAGGEVRTLAWELPSLEATFLELVGRE
jgi:ABC-2 type transport system ATP-binding protein